mmetsp:Transcript_20061/g.22712  ORF Transcript_20061/g.22712 Transcript_20061/m.22712 type:complete len:594 (+) Transcript_20061:49-1830(+)
MSATITETQSKKISQLITEQCTLLCTAVIKLYTSSGKEPKWVDSTLIGGLCLIVDRKLKAKVFRMFELNTYDLLFETELYEDFKEHYHELNEYFHCFEIDGGYVGFSFSDSKDASKFKTQINLYSDKGEREIEIEHTQSAPLRETDKKKKKGGWFNLFRKKKRDEEEEDEKFEFVISKPTMVQHNDHISWDPVNQCFILDNLSPDLKRIFKNAGIRKKDLKDKESALIIFKTLINTNTFEKVPEDLQNMTEGGTNAEGGEGTGHDEDAKNDDGWTTSDATSNREGSIASQRLESKTTLHSRNISEKSQHSRNVSEKFSHSRNVSEGAKSIKSLRAETTTSDVGSLKQDQSSHATSLADGGDLKPLEEIAASSLEEDKTLQETGSVIIHDTNQSTDSGKLAAVDEKTEIDEETKTTTTTTQPTLKAPDLSILNLNPTASKTTNTTTTTSSTLAAPDLSILNLPIQKTTTAATTKPTTTTAKPTSSTTTGSLNSITASALQGVKLRKAEPKPTQTTSNTDGGGGGGQGQLLNQIRQGVTLKKVDQSLKLKNIDENQEIKLTNTLARAIAHRRQQLTKGKESDSDDSDWSDSDDSD